MGHVIEEFHMRGPVHVSCRSPRHTGAGHEKDDSVSEAYRDTWCTGTNTCDRMRLAYTVRWLVGCGMCLCAAPSETR